MKEYFVYIMASRSRTLYTGVTSDLTRRVWEHRHAARGGFTAKYKAHRLVYYQSTPNISAAIARERQIKGWLRARKIALIESINPTWEDLAPDDVAVGKRTADSSLRSE
ncbi:MAG: GIY-YIG nuclease family protein [Candidatus Zixiibacteriota bacterium]